MDENRGLLSALAGDGRPLLAFTGLALVLSGLFAWFQSATGHLLPHDSAYLGLDAAELCAYQGCAILRFMIHDRVAFGGTLIAIGSLYLWLAAYPLSHRRGWAWLALAVSGLIGFASFLTYLGYGYLDTWHGVASLGLLPVFVAGLVLVLRILPPGGLRAALRPANRPNLRTPFGIGYALLGLVAFGILAAGVTITTIGVRVIFVPQDLSFMAATRLDLHAINPRLVSLIAHDRAGFGGGLFSVGSALLIILAHARPSRSLWQILLVAGLSGFGAAIGIHYIVGYTDFTHVGPAIAGLAVFLVGLALTYRGMHAPAQAD
jgi:hypothetical protein